MARIHPVLAAAALTACAAVGWATLGHLPDAQRTVQVGSASFIVEVADEPAEQVRGLSGRSELAEGHGMLFIFPDTQPRMFWMKDMLFSIDIVWVRAGIVVGVTEHAVPEPGVATVDLTRYSSPEPVDTALEIPGGAFSRSDIRIGDTLTFVP